VTAVSKAVGPGPESPLPGESPGAILTPVKILRRSYLTYWFLAATFLALTGCAGVRVQPLMPTPVIYTEMGFGPLDHIPEDRRWTPRMVYYATTRERIPDLQRIEYNNNESDLLSMGLALVGFGGSGVTWSDLNRYSQQEERDSVVDLSIAGLVEAGRFDPRPDADTNDETGVKWVLAQLNESIESAMDKDLLVYVHGAKVNFYNACAFAAQLDHFMGRAMTSLAFAWPTRQNIVAYGSGGDVRRAYRHAHALTRLLERLADETTARRIHLVAWSAGGRVVTEALAELHARHAETYPSLRERFRIGTVYLAAADVPGDQFLSALPKLDEVAYRIVVTNSDNDDALLLAKRFMGGDTRIGVVRGELTQEEDTIVRAAEHLEVVNVSLGSDDRGFNITGHRYWFDHPWASSDLILAVRSDFDPEERALEKQAYPVLWSIPADYPERLREALSRPGLKIRR